jgi:methyl-accepting chemotaxis protein
VRGKMTIGKKLYLGFGAILAMVLLLFFLNTFAAIREQTARSETARSLEMAQATEALRFQMMQNRLHLGNYLLSGDTREAESLNAGVERFTTIIKETEDKALTDAERDAVQRVHRQEQLWRESFCAPLLAKRKEVDSGKATVADLEIFYLQQNPAEWLRRATEPLDEAERINTKIVAEKRGTNDRATYVSSFVSVLGTLVAILLGLGIAFFTARSITEPLDRLISIARQIGKSGDLDHTVDIHRNDEIGELATTVGSMVVYLKEMAQVSEAIAGGDLTVRVEPRSARDTLANAFSRMVGGLSTLVKSVRDGAAQVASGSAQVADASDESAKIGVQASSAIDEVTSTMHEMSVNVQNMVKNTQTQAASVSETSASIDQMVTSIQRVADTAKVLLDISHRSREEVNSGIGTMEKATDGLNRINVSIQSSASIIGALGLRADDIGKIIEVIDDLAEQTNLLALNAAIEAARAGEHGLGFAVVADEVRKLAEKSAQSTKEIAELIQSIQREARKAVENMEKSTSIVNEGLTHGADLSTALRKIANVVSEVYKFAQEIGAATNEQSHGSSQIARATTRLNEITHEINSAVEEQASGAQAVVRAMEQMRELVQQSTSGSTELAASSEQMSKMAATLLEMMDRFTLEESLSNTPRAYRQTVIRHAGLSAAAAVGLGAPRSAETSVTHTI